MTRASFTAHGACRSALFDGGKGTKKSRTSKEIRENFQEIGTFSLISTTKLNKLALFFNKKAPACMIQTGDKLSFLFCQLRIA